MVGIVVVSHSRALAGAAVALAREMVPGSLRIEVAAGLDAETYGTDALAVSAAITAADDGVGVVVLMDIGSAVLSTDLALELLDDDVRGRVRLSAAPLVEGLLAAAVSAAGGATPEEVAREAEAGLTGKLAQLGGALVREHSGGNGGGSDDNSGHDESDDGSTGVVSARLTVRNQHGLHARPAARLAHLAGDLDANVRIRNVTTRSPWVSAASLSRLGALGAARGHELEVAASGPGGPEVLDAIQDLAAHNFGEPEQAEPGPHAEPTLPAEPTTRADPVEAPILPADPDPHPEPVEERPPDAQRILVGVPASPGIGIGAAWSLSGGPLDVTDNSTNSSTGSWTGDPVAERQRLDDALAVVARDVRDLVAHVFAELGPDEAGIFQAHLLLLGDPELLDDAYAAIDNGRSAASAWSAAVSATEHAWAALPDSYLRGRAADIGAVRDQVLRALAGAATLAESRAGVLLAADLSPGAAAALDPTSTTGVALAYGSPTAHAAILVRAHGIPLVVGVGAALLGVGAGTEVAVDGSRGEVIVGPSVHRRVALAHEAGRRERSTAEALRAANRPAITADGLQIQVGANLGSLADARAAAASGADLAGLVRTEFLFLGRDTAPPVDEQVATYRALADALGGRRLTLRTLDVGGDKPLPYVPVPGSDNPFLGVRGLRLSLAAPDLFADQLRAIVRTAYETPVSVMFPMVSTLAELHAARRLLDHVVASEGRGDPVGMEVGIMVEVPAAALKAAEFAASVDFFSIGTNDLTQYALAAERGNPDVAAIGDAYDPGVLALIRAVCLGAAGAAGLAGVAGLRPSRADASGVGSGAHVAVCGDLAADPAAAALLVGLGVGTLSVSPPAIPLVKQAVRAVDSGRAEDLAAAALASPGPAEVRALL